MFVLGVSTVSKILLIEQVKLVLIFAVKIIGLYTVSLQRTTFAYTIKPKTHTFGIEKNYCYQHILSLNKIEIVQEAEHIV
jgi:hypothetical protein